MNYLQPEFTTRNADVRSILNISPATLSELCKKIGVSFVDSSETKGKPKNLAGSEVRKILESRGYTFPKRAKVIICGINKGGAGKTTITNYLSQRLSSLGARVCVIDGDPQGNLTLAFNTEKYGVEIDKNTPVLLDVLNEKLTFEEALIRITPTLHLLPSTPFNSGLENCIRTKWKNPVIPIKNLLSQTFDKYDYIFIDTAPTFNMTNTAFYSNADTVLMPANPDKFSMMSLEQTFSELEDIEKQFAIKIDKKIVYTKYDKREILSNIKFAEIVSKYPQNILKTIMNVSADTKNAIDRGAYLFDMKSTAKDDFDSLAVEIMGLAVISKKQTIQ